MCELGITMATSALGTYSQVAGKSELDGVLKPCFTVIRIRKKYQPVSIYVPTYGFDMQSSVKAEICKRNFKYNFKDKFIRQQENNKKQYLPIYEKLINI